MYFMLNVFYAKCHLCWMSFKLNVIYAVYHMASTLCWVSHTSTLCWVSHTSTLCFVSSMMCFYALCLLYWVFYCWVSFMLCVIYAQSHIIALYSELHQDECLLCWCHLCWVSHTSLLFWASSRWVSWSSDSVFLRMPP
jgi:hypothetical protein